MDMMEKRIFDPGTSASAAKGSQQSDHPDCKDEYKYSVKVYEVHTFKTGFVFKNGRSIPNLDSQIKIKCAIKM